MDYKSINIYKIKKEDLIRNLLEGDFPRPTVNEKKEIQKTIESSIKKARYLSARNALILGIFFDTDKTFLNIRKKGLFRYSKYISQKCIVKNLAFELLELSEQIGCISESDTKYLKSILNLSNLHDSYNTIQKFILHEIKSFKIRYKGKSIIKSLLSYVDYLFLSGHYPESMNDLKKVSSRLNEDICSAVSYLIYFISEQKYLNLLDTKFVCEEYIKNGEIDRIIIAACFISDFKEFEILIDHFKYECIERNDKLQIKPPSEDFEKSIRLGYIREQLQYHNDLINTDDGEEDKGVSFDDLVGELNKNENIIFFKLVETQDYPRYRVEIPEPLFEFIVNRFFKPDLLFKEEITYLAKVFKEQLLNPSDLQNLKIKGDLNLMEFIKIRRVFILFYLLFSKQIIKEEKNDIDLVLRSLIPMFPKEAFYKLLEDLTQIENVDAYLDIVCWEPDLNILFDLQYHPILFLNEHFLIPLTIFVNSNSIRNLYASEYKQNNRNLLTDGLVDALVEKLQRSFRIANIQSFKQTSIPNTDIDLFAIWEDTLFLFECKQSLHPVSTYDLRTTYDYILKAEKQLDYLNQEFYNGNLIKILGAKYNVNMDKITKVVSSIVLSNRLFNGNTFKYPIRNINEIENILERGTMKTDKGEFWLWHNNELSLSDLVDYFSLDSKLVKLFFDSVSVKTLTYELTNPNIEFDTYYMDSKKAIPLLNSYTLTLRKK